MIIDYIPNQTFNWIPDRKTFVTEASSVFSRIPHKFSIRNPKTGNVADFVLVSRDRDSEGELVSWSFWNEKHMIGAVVYND